LITISPKVFVRDVQSVVASAVVTSTAGVDSNPYNTLAAQLKDKEVTLNKREQQLNTAAQKVSNDSFAADSIAWVSLAVSAALFVLVGFNFYFDYRRQRGSGNSRSLRLDLRSAR
jgi:hypothetical protein